MSLCETTEPCHTGDCSGTDEVQRLLPPGRLWNLGNNALLSRSFQALGNVKTCINQAICQELAERDPCKAQRLADYWAGIYFFPIECADISRLCEWVELVENPDCPIGSLAFYRAAVEFLASGKGITLSFNQPGLLAGKCLRDDLAQPQNNVICVSAPADCYQWDDSDLSVQDGENERCYFIPEIECLRYHVFPFISLGYKTDEINPNGAPIFGVADSAQSPKPSFFYNPKRRC